MNTKLIATVSLIVMYTLLSGCSTETKQADSNRDSTASHPNLSLHKPKTFTAAIDRLQQMHESLVGDGEFPAPISIPYVEVIHGEGASGHSHFYSAAEYESNEGDGHDDGHHEEDEKVKRHTVEVELRTELTDVAAWLPSLAAKSNLSEADWNSVGSISNNLKEIVGGIASDASNDSFRESWKGNSEKIKAMMDELRSFADSSGEAK